MQSKLADAKFSSSHSRCLSFFLFLFIFCILTFLTFCECYTFVCHIKTYLWPVYCSAFISIDYCTNWIIPLSFERLVVIDIQHFFSNNRTTYAVLISFFNFIKYLSGERDKKLVTQIYHVVLNVGVPNFDWNDGKIVLEFETLSFIIQKFWV